jgi:hypothetical protein
MQRKEEPLHFSKHEHSQPMFADGTRLKRLNEHTRTAQPVRKVDVGHEPVAYNPHLSSVLVAE